MFTWKPIYTEIAEKLLAYRKKQDQLLSWLQEMKDAGLPIISLKDQNPKKNEIPLAEIDPFTFFANFNRGIKNESRVEIISRLRDKLNIESPLPNDFDGIPVVNLQKAWFFPYAYMRKSSDIENLWSLTEQIINRNPSDIDAKIFESCLKITHIASSKLSIGMFWLQPDRYLSFDHRNIEYFVRKGFEKHSMEFSTLSKYLENMQLVRDQLRMTFPEISREAYTSSIKLELDLNKLNIGFLKLLENAATKNGLKIDEFVNRISIYDQKDGENEITNRVKWMKELSSIINSGEMNEANLKKTLDKLWVLGGRFDIMRRNAFLKSGEGIQSIEELLTANLESDFASKINEFIESATLNGYDAVRSNDRTLQAQFASVFLSARYPDRFVDFKMQRWNSLYQQIYEQNERPFSKKEFGSQIILAGSFASQLVQTPTYKKYFGTDPNLWKVAGLAYLFKDGPFILPILENPPPKPQPEPGDSNGKQKALNIILCGPPGTGKTYQAICRAVELIDRSPADKEFSNIKKRFDQLIEQSRIAFVTFHQTYSYEDFVEGIRPVLAEEATASTPKYVCRDGIFKTICKAARNRSIKGSVSGKIDLNNASIWKMSLGNTLIPEDSQIYEDCVENNYIAHGFAQHIDFSDCSSQDAIRNKLNSELKQDSVDQFAIQAVDRLKNQMQIGDLVIVSDGNYRFRAIGRIIGNYEFHGDRRYSQTRPVEWIKVFEESQPRERILREKIFSQATIYRLKREDLNLDVLQEMISPFEGNKPEYYVLIIDEINRGNISKILGELITLIEDDKREGQKCQLSATLPYSQEKFSVPSNLYILGTMNTADKSIAFVDVAIRRRFEFEELMPDFDVCQNLADDMKEIIKELNRRICLRKDRDHQIGHSYFMDVKDKAAFNRVFDKKIIPLLFEYFYNDVVGLRYVLGEDNKDSGTFFISVNKEQEKWARSKWNWHKDIDKAEMKSIPSIFETLTKNYKDKTTSNE